MWLLKNTQQWCALPFIQAFPSVVFVTGVRSVRLVQLLLLFLLLFLLPSFRVSGALKEENGNQTAEPGEWPMISRCGSLGALPSIILPIIKQHHSRNTIRYFSS